MFMGKAKVYISRPWQSSGAELRSTNCRAALVYARGLCKEINFFGLFYGLSKRLRIQFEHRPCLRLGCPFMQEVSWSKLGQSLFPWLGQ